MALAFKPMYSGSFEQNWLTSSAASRLTSGYLSVSTLASTSATADMHDLKTSGQSRRTALSMVTMSRRTSSLVSGKGTALTLPSSTSTILATESAEQGANLARASSASFRALSRTKSTSSQMQKTRFLSTCCSKTSLPASGQLRVPDCTSGPSSFCLMATTAFLLTVLSSVTRCYAVEQTVYVSLELQQDLRLGSFGLFHSL